MSYFAPNLIPGHHMIPALISSEEFHATIGKLAPRLALHLLYVENYSSIIVVPLHWLALVESARLEANLGKKPNPKYAEYLRGLTREWISIIATGAVEHPLRAKLLAGIQKALIGDLSPVPVWVGYFDACRATGDDDTIHLRPTSTLTHKVKDGGVGTSTEVAADLNRVLAVLGYGKAENVKRGPKSK